MSRFRIPSRRDRGDAFLPDPAGGTFIAAPEGESLAEEFIAAVTSADFVLEESRNELSVDEIDDGLFEVEDEVESYD